MKQPAKVDLLYIDDFGLAQLADQSERDRLEILEDRYDKRIDVDHQLSFRPINGTPVLDEPTSLSRSSIAVHNSLSC